MYAILHNTIFGGIIQQRVDDEDYIENIMGNSSEVQNVMITTLNSR